MLSFMHRRKVLAALSGSVLTGWSGCARREPSPGQAHAPINDVTSHAPGKPEIHRQVPVVLDSFALNAGPWRTFDPFLFCVHHNDRYPRGDGALAPAASLEGRRIGNDFAGKDGWSMYHGATVPGFPRHPHRGFETVTLARRGFIDHSDSLGATARFGEGDVQWMTAGSGVVHSEMFPLVNKERENPTELFQIWLNLPRQNKFVPPHFSMLWSDTIPSREVADEAGKSTRLVQITGAMGGVNAPASPPHSWASSDQSETAIWTLTMAAGARFSLPAVGLHTHRTLYFFRGRSLSVGGEEFAAGRGIRLTPGAPVTLVNAQTESEVLLLQARPIGEPVVQRGPFVMNEEQEIVQAYRDYRRTGFGGWPWPLPGPVHEPSKGRFAVHADGRRETAS